MQSIAYANSNTSIMRSEEATTKTASVPRHHHKASHHQHHDEETTAYSSWHDEEDCNSQLSSCLSSVDLNDDHDACVGEDDEQFHRRSVILLSSSECSLLDNNDVDDDYHAVNKYDSSSSLTTGSKSLKVEEVEMNNRMAAFQDLSEQASHLLKLERSPEYAVDDYFQRSYYDSTADESTSEIEYLIPLSSDYSTSRRSSKPIDSSCRSKMMEWSYRIIEFSFPPNPNPQQKERQQSSDSSASREESVKTKTRKHSTESLQLLCTTFSYIDRLCTKFKVVDREEYKLLCMVCLNLAAKSSGLYASDNEREWYKFSNHQFSGACCLHEHSSEGTTATTSPSSSSCDNIDTSSSKDSAFTGQTILSTPEQDNVGMLEQPSRPRPPMDLISLPGLHALCNGIFTKEQFDEMEYIILHRGLGWRLHGVQSLDWIDLCLELLSLLQLDENRCLAREDYHDIREVVMVQLEYAAEISSLVGCAPSLLAVAAFLNAAEGYSDDEDCILDCIEEVLRLSFDRSEMASIRNVIRA
eukprot:scaffold4187_cov135-Skeletonema_menzelii.AAC.5